MKNIEIVLECPICEGMIVLQMTPQSQVKELFEPCAVCKVLATVS